MLGCSTIKCLLQSDLSELPTNCRNALVSFRPSATARTSSTSKSNLRAAAQRRILLTEGCATGQLPNGASCSSGSDCQSGYCVSTFVVDYVPPTCRDSCALDGEGVVNGDASCSCCWGESFGTDTFNAGVESCHMGGAANCPRGETPDGFDCTSSADCSSGFCLYDNSDTRFKCATYCGEIGLSSVAGSAECSCCTGQGMGPGTGAFGSDRCTMPAEPATRNGPCGLRSASI